MGSLLKRRWRWLLLASLALFGGVWLWLLFNQEPGLIWGNYLRIRQGMSRQEVERLLGERFPVECVRRLAFRNDRLWVLVDLDGHERVERKELILPERTFLGKLQRWWRSPIKAQPSHHPRMTGW